MPEADLISNPYQNLLTALLGGQQRNDIDETTNQTVTGTSGQTVTGTQNQQQNQQTVNNQTQNQTQNQTSNTNTNTTGSQNTTGQVTGSQQNTATTNQTTTSTANIDPLMQVFAQQQGGITPQVLAALFAEGAKAAPGLVTLNANAVGARAGNNTPLATATSGLMAELTNKAAMLNQQMLADSSATAGRIADATRSTTTTGTQANTGTTSQATSQQTQSTQQQAVQQLLNSILGTTSQSNQNTTGSTTGTNTQNTTGTNTQNTSTDRSVDQDQSNTLNTDMLGMLLGGGLLGNVLGGGGIGGLLTGLLGGGTGGSGGSGGGGLLGGAGGLLGSLWDRLNGINSGGLNLDGLDFSDLFDPDTLTNDFGQIPLEDILGGADLPDMADLPWMDDWFEWDLGFADGGTTPPSSSVRMAKPNMQQLLPMLLAMSVAKKKQAAGGQPSGNRWDNVAVTTDKGGRKVGGARILDSGGVRTTKNGAMFDARDWGDANVQSFLKHIGKGDKVDALADSRLKSEYQQYLQSPEVTGWDYGWDNRQDATLPKSFEEWSKTQDKYGTRRVETTQGDGPTQHEERGLDYLSDQDLAETLSKYEFVRVGAAPGQPDIARNRAAIDKTTGKVAWMDTPYAYNSWKDAVKEGVGVLGFAAAPWAAGAIGGALGLSGLGAQAAGGALFGAGKSALTGGNILQGALGGGLGPGLNMAGLTGVQGMLAKQLLMKALFQPRRPPGAMDGMDIPDDPSDPKGIMDTYTIRVSGGERVIPADVNRAMGEDFWETLIAKHHVPADLQKALGGMQ